MSLLLRRLCCAESLTPEERDAKVDELVSFVRHAAANHLDTPVRTVSPFAGWGLWIGCEPRVAGGSREPFWFLGARFTEFAQTVWSTGPLPRLRRLMLPFA